MPAPKGHRMAALSWRDRGTQAPGWGGSQLLRILQAGRRQEGSEFQMHLQGAASAISLRGGWPPVPGTR